ncbi:LysM peptidoglycan-binding domain-containing protein [Virgibacillus ihumii]|uniref:LysM peptidoglycan-binding domain-containing protein n=1 Tax=Virgibacillus ihumii TaxID=2686091 RepID=UPI00157C1E29|nr:LysM domain-containing protein [Virgibacillus ihumii]
MNCFYTHTIQPGDNYWLLAYLYHTSTERIIDANPEADPYYLRIGQHITIPVTTFPDRPEETNHCISQAELKFRKEMVALWEEHVAWTRMVIISLTFDLPDVEFVIARLLQNATDMGDMLRELYGDAAGETYAELIKEHLLFAADLVNAAIAGDEQAAMEAEEKWYDNADQIAAFLSSINPFLTEQVVRDMFYTHLDLTKQEAVFMINMEYQKDIEVYDAIEEQAREMADTIADAMIKLYPSMF